MSAKFLPQSVSSESRYSSLFEEMQREDFLALAAAMRRFNLFESQLAMADALGHPGESRPLPELEEVRRIA
ncbi:hypothetical protein RRX38_05560 [Pseudomonas sp. DTU_2021_1001937_2_SI_NGA_ILE_001]|uniref:hypothetical protein n=1 Tax=Pseudomonas sp. DTU_2021_1001937_2_SI_NGA_ILE_001 TaxID=3077589 RepID=UPI0025FC4A39|nr:hypothetical protein [Pseudomonas sp. DTU_2021_1001937_2_SI_NGA_ILE_001]WNW10643.1 hypothetical protein RRX38_05560 [Pseudomonas sp. DTU_2021_1001937_2_SI_NGA_ILE_001]